jgi:hypothetical protein
VNPDGAWLSSLCQGRGRVVAIAFACVVIICSVRPAYAGATVPGAVDRAVARFYAPETGGTAYPRFVFERILAFEARLAAMAEVSEGIGNDYDERDVREALEHHVAV